jgi:hypothetical protein
VSATIIIEIMTTLMLMRAICVSHKQRNIVLCDDKDIIATNDNRDQKKV